jgi:hypothetical protein
VLDRTRPKAVAESRLHSSSVKVHGAPSPRWNPWQRGRREHPRAGNPRSLPIWRAQVKSSEPLDLDRALSALVPGEQRGCVGLACCDSGKHPLSASGAFRHRPTVVDLRAGLAAVDRERQWNQAVGPARGTKDHQNEGMVPRPRTFHVSVRKPFADPERPVFSAPSRARPFAKCRFADRRRVARMGRSRPCAGMSCLRCRLPGPAVVP